MNEITCWSTQAFYECPSKFWPTPRNSCKFVSSCTSLSSSLSLEITRAPEDWLFFAAFTLGSNTFYSCFSKKCFAGYFPDPGSLPAPASFNETFPNGFFKLYQEL